jgi:ATP-dependent exoDNAse (exonuclease V) beta subunit
VQRLAGCTPAELREHGTDEMALEGEEAVRLLYVAATRARDVLVVPVIGDERRESWLHALWPAVYPGRPRNTVADSVPGCPAFGEDSVPLRPPGTARPMGSVKPGVHAAQTGDHLVVWWDPSALELGVRPNIGLAQTKILEEDKQGRAGAGGAAYEEWKVDRASTRERGGQPTVVVSPATEWIEAHEEIVGQGKVAVAEIPREGARPRGRRFGTLVHALLSSVGLDDDDDAVAAHAAAQSRLFGASEEERDAATRTVRAALAHPLLRRAAAAALEGRCRREAPLVVRLADGTVLESVVDLAFLEEGVWQVVDFKSDADPTPLLDGYRRQVALYAMGITDATGLPAQGTILKI